MFKYKEFRRAHGLFQSQLAEIMGLSQSNISRYETEGIDPTPAQFKKLYDKFGEEDVKAFEVEPQFVNAENNVNNDSGNQNNGIQNDTDLIEIIKKQTETIAKHVERQDEINACLMDLLEKMALK
jgi:transcriptional regulator with XRE-family HTH domain